MNELFYCIFARKFSQLISILDVTVFLLKTKHNCQVFFSINYATHGCLVPLFNYVHADGVYLPILFIAGYFCTIGRDFQFYIISLMSLKIYTNKQKK